MLVCFLIKQMKVEEEGGEGGSSRDGEESLRNSNAKQNIPLGRTYRFSRCGKAEMKLHYSSHLAAGTWGVTEMLASFDPGMGAWQALLSSVAPPSQLGGVREGSREGGWGGGVCTHSTSC